MLQEVQEGGVIKRDTSVRVIGRSMYVSSMEPHSALSTADGSEAEEDWQSTHAGQELESLG